MTLLLLVALGAAVGAPLRYLTDRAIQTRHPSLFPWGTLAVNVAGALVLGFVLGLPPANGLMALVGTGFCGALTTYSTFSYETVRLIQDGSRLYALVNLTASIVAGLGAAVLGYAAAGAVVG
ncbi:fluoride efflux transporter CrcB [Catellatospora paridis]|uniref:fluoride efflux transporter CrcB n=1 Tax=Catellatospora paridis TaxID=1617086 RepID=UPI0012D3ABB3|nr:fluoride efflux transporter CrcB [Catellatospora paridis]